MGLLYVFDVDGMTPGSHVILVWIDLKSDQQYFDYNTRVDTMLVLDVCMYNPIYHSNIQGAYQKFCTLTINFFIMHFTCHLSHQL